MNKKTLIALLSLIVAFMLVFTACSDKADSDEKNNDETTVQAEETTAANDSLISGSEETTGQIVVTVPTPSVSVTEANTSLSEISYAGYTSYNTIEGFTFYYDSNGIVKKISLEIVAIPGNVTSEASTVIEGLYSKANSYKSNGYDVVADKSDATADVYYSEMIINLSSAKEINLFYEILGSSSTATVLTLSEAESFVKSNGYTEYDPQTDDINDIITPTVDDTVPSSSAEATTGAGEVCYTGYTSYNTLEGFTFVYDANGYVTQVCIEEVSDPYSVASQTTIDIFDKLYDKFEDLKNQGYNITVDYSVIDGVCYLEAVMLLTSDKEVSALGDMLKTTFSGTTVTLTQAENAAKTQGYSVFEG